MEPDLLKKEQEYHKENQKLEVKTKELMKKVDDVMRLQDEILKGKFCPKAIINDNAIGDNSFVKCNDDVITLQDLNIPASVDDVNLRAKLCYFNTYIKTLKSDLSKLHQECNLKDEALYHLQNENVKLYEERKRMLVRTASDRNMSTKYETMISNLNNTIAEREGEINSLKKHNVALKREVKTLKGEIIALEIQLNNFTGEADKYKNELKKIKEHEKSTNDNHKKKIKELEAVIKNKDKNKADLHEGFKKQQLLIDNLKKQKMHIEATQIAEVSHHMYLKLLDWNVTA